MSPPRAARPQFRLARSRRSPMPSAGMTSRRFGEALRRAAGTPPRAGSTGARSARSPEAMVRAQRPGVDAGALEDAGLDRHRRARRSGRGRCRPSAPACAARCPSSSLRRAARAGCRRTRAWSLRQWPSSSSSSRFSSIAPASTIASARRLAAREGDEQPVVEQGAPCRRRRSRRAGRAARSRAGRGGARRRPPGWSPRADRA